METIVNLTDQISPVTIIVFAGIAVFFHVLVLIPVGLWFAATAQGVKISIAELLLMRWRKVPVNDMLNALIISNKEGLQITSKQLQFHYLVLVFKVRWLRYGRHSCQSITLVNS